ncbi:hypothetical protein SVIOM342S_10534 [Streptomyces violaceorubidus]
MRAGPPLCVYSMCAVASTFPLASAASATAFAASASVPTSTFRARTSYVTSPGSSATFPVALSPCAMSPPEAGWEGDGAVSAVAPPFASAPVSSSPPPHAVRARARAATGAARRRAVLRCGTTGSCMQMCLFPRTVDQGRGA